MCFILWPLAFAGPRDTSVSPNRNHQDSRHTDDWLAAQPSKAKLVAEARTRLASCAASTTVDTQSSDSHGECRGATGMPHVVPHTQARTHRARFARKTVTVQKLLWLHPDSIFVVPDATATLVLCCFLYGASQVDIFVRGHSPEPPCLCQRGRQYFSVV